MTGRCDRLDRRGAWLTRIVPVAALLACAACDPQTVIALQPIGPGSAPQPLPEAAAETAEPVATGPITLAVEEVGGPPAQLVMPSDVVIDGFALAPDMPAVPGSPVMVQLDLSKPAWNAPNVTVTAALVLRSAGGAQQGEVYRTVRLDRRSLSAVIAGPTPQGTGRRTVELRLLDPRSGQVVGRAAAIPVTVSNAPPAPAAAPAES